MQFMNTPSRRQLIDGRQTVEAAEAPAAIGPYSHAVQHAGVLYCSGALPIDPDSSELVDASLADETSRCLANLEAVCQAAGTSLRHALRLTIYTIELEAFAEINAAYGAAFDDAPPARVTAGVAALPRAARVEIDAIVALV
jgi:2-iminobutanoate/2-iminopropanoate deaminase